MIGDYLANRMRKIIKKNLNKAKISDAALAQVIEELRLCLLEADVNTQVVDDMLTELATTAETTIVESHLKPDQMMIKLLHAAIVKTLGTNTATINCNARPTTVMLVGLQGAGKTTTIAKVAHFLAKQNNKKPVLVAADLVRPGAIAQLQTLGQQLQLPVFTLPKAKNSLQVAQKSLKFAKNNGNDLILIDTAGRAQVNEALMEELQTIRNKTSPQEIILVVDGVIGQIILDQIKTFDQYLKLTGVIVTKLDGDNRGGAVLSIKAITGLPIYFIGTGEKISNLQKFYPDRMANRILGMGDIKTLFETVNDVLDQRTIKTTMQRMMRGQFDLQDMLNQLKQLKRMGSLQKISRLIPGAPNISADKIASVEGRLANANILISSMTNQERREVRLLKHISRKQRIIKGAGSSEKHYNTLINNYQRSKKQVDQIAKSLKQGRMPEIPGFKN